MTQNTGSSAIDRSVLEQIRMLEGPGRQGLLEKVVTLYLCDSQKLVEKIRTCVEGKDADALRRAAHTLKSSSANVGAVGVFEICRRIEEGTADGSLPSSGSQVERLEGEYGSVRQELQAMLETGQWKDNGCA